MLGEIDKFNLKLRETLLKIKDEGYKTADISNLLMQSSSSQLARFLKDETDFGIKPITKLANQAGYDTFIITIKQDEQDALREAIVEHTEMFFMDLYDDVVKCLSVRYAGNVNGNIPRNTISKSTIDDILSELEL